MTEAQSVLAELEQLRYRLLEVCGPAIRCTLEAAARDRRRALKLGDFLAAEDWRRCVAAAGRLLQAAEEHA